MNIIQPSFEIMAFTPDMTKLIERGIRTAYKSEERIEEGSDAKIIGHVKSLQHESTLEHGVITVKIICDRGISHEIVRHRIASFTQESTRYCNYGKGKFGNQITVIDLATGFNYDLNDPKDAKKYEIWNRAMAAAEGFYMEMLEAEAKPQEARSVLPNSLKTEIVITANVREWRKIMELRTSNAAHPQIRQIMAALLVRFRANWNMLFDDVGSTEHPQYADEIFPEQTTPFNVFTGDLG